MNHRQPPADDSDDEIVEPDLADDEDSSAEASAFQALTPERVARQCDDFGRCLANLAHKLRRFPTRRGITCFRIYERDVPEVPLVIDRYEDCLHIAEFARGRHHTPDEHAAWLDRLIEVAASVLQTPPERIFVKRRRRLAGRSQYERLEDADRPERWGAGDPIRIVGEAGLKFEINLSQYLDVGLFLDHRVTRTMFRQEAAGKRVLNLFCYTGAFTLHAAAGGAISTTSVDLSNTYLDWAQRNLALNGLDLPQHQRFRSDCLAYLRDLPARPQFDLAIVDPPTHSRSKRTPEDWDVQTNHAELLSLLVQRLSPGGVIYFSTNFRQFKFDESCVSPASPREITHRTIPEEFRNRRIHRCWRIVL